MREHVPPHFSERVWMLVTIPNVLSADEVAHCRKIVEEAAWVDGVVTAGEQAAVAKKNLQIPEDSQAARQAGEMILRALGRNGMFNSAALPLRVLPPLFNRYDTGMKFDAHVDGAIRAVPGAASACAPTCPPHSFLRRPRSMTAASSLSTTPMARIR